MQEIRTGGKAARFGLPHARNWLLLGMVVATGLLVGPAAWPGGSKPAQAATARATIGVSVRVLEDCSALLDSSTTIITASFACRGSPVAMILSPTVSSTSLAILAPMAFSGQAAGSAAPGSSGASTGGPSGGTSGGVPLSPAGAISVRSPTSDFVASTDEASDGRIVTITY